MKLLYCKATKGVLMCLDCPSVLTCLEESGGSRNVLKEVPNYVQRCLEMSRGVQRSSVETKVVPQYRGVFNCGEYTFTCTSLDTFCV